MSLLAIDIETFSDVDLPKCGSYAYSDSPRFEILLLAYAFDDEPTQVVDLARGEQLPDRVLAALEDEAVTKTAFNAAFERTCISRYLGRQLSPASWQCTAVQSAMPVKKRAFASGVVRVDNAPTVVTKPPYALAPLFLSLTPSRICVHVEDCGLYNQTAWPP